QPAGRGHHGHGAGRGRRHAGPADPAETGLIRRASGRRMSEPDIPPRQLTAAPIGVVVGIPRLQAGEDVKYISHHLDHLGCAARWRPHRRRGERRMTKITGFDTFDVRFPTSRTLAGSDAMNPAPDYSAAYVVIRTDASDPALSGHGFAFTIGRGNDVQLAAIRLLEPFLAGQDLDEVLADLGGLGRRLVSDSPLHWLGPSCGV